MPPIDAIQKLPENFRPFATELRGRLVRIEEQLTILISRPAFQPIPADLIDTINGAAKTVSVLDGRNQSEVTRRYHAG